MAEAEYEEIDVPVRENTEEAEIRDTDIVFDCPHCGKNLVIDYRGAKEDLMVKIAAWIEEVLNEPENEAVIAKVRSEVNETMKNYPLFAW